METANSQSSAAIDSVQDAPRSVRQTSRAAPRVTGQGSELGDIRIRQLSHTASRVKDLSETQKFYEDFLELPLVTSMLADFDAGTGEPSDYIHCFFRMADGSCIAFFQFGEGYRGDVVPALGDPYDRHIALRVDDVETVTSFKAKADARGIPSITVDHDDFYSLYLTDPDGNHVEVTWHKPTLEQIVDCAVAHEVLHGWLNKQAAVRAGQQ